MTPHQVSCGSRTQQQQQLAWLPPPGTVQTHPSCVSMPPACHAQPAPTDCEGPSGPEDAWLQQQAGGSDGDEPGSPAGSSRPSQAAAAALQREDWMTVPMARPFAGQPDDKQQQQQQKEKEVRGLHLSGEAPVGS